MGNINFIEMILEMPLFNTSSTKQNKNKVEKGSLA